MQIESARRQATRCPPGVRRNKDSRAASAAALGPLLRASGGMQLTSAPLCELLATPQGAQLNCLFNDAVSTYVQPAGTE